PMHSLEPLNLADRFVINATSRVRDDATGDTNALARSSQVDVMLCPSDDANAVAFVGSASGAGPETWARGNYGLNAVHFWPNQFWPNFKQATVDNASMADFGFQIGISGFDNGSDSQALSMKQITDGTSKTLMIAEMRAGVDETDRRGVWAMAMCGSSFHCRHIDAPPNDCTPSHDDVYEGPDLVTKISEVGLNQQCMGVDRSVDASGQSTVRSQHPGGVIGALADASVRYFSDSIETGAFTLAGEIQAEQTNEDDFLTWQRLNVSRDSFTVSEY
ncbi:MAG: DUF1559 domain-containing protein, partial [Planctomycetota bacterium]